MHVVRRLLGLGLVTLGVLGIIVCLAGIAGVWMAGSRLQQITANVFSRVDQLIDQVDRRGAQAGDAVGRTRELVDRLKQELEDSARELLAERTRDVFLRQARAQPFPGAADAAHQDRVFVPLPQVPPVRECVSKTSGTSTRQAMG
jgi:hypothetical protein